MKILEGGFVANEQKKLLQLFRGFKLRHVGENENIGADHSSVEMLMVLIHNGACLRFILITF